MSAADKDGMAQTIPVTIYNQHYNLRAAADGAHIAQVAQLVDARMREVAQSIHSVETLKIAILAALNIADELSRVRQLCAAQQAELNALNAAPTPPVEPAAMQTPPADNDAPAAAPRWSYADIFEDAPARQSTAERLSNRVANRLQTLRPAQPELTILSDNEEA